MPAKDIIDTRMNAIMHKAFRRDIDTIRAAVRTAQGEGSAVPEGVVRRWQFLSEQLQHHHEGEDKFLWPMAEERANQPQEQVVLRAMTAEHGAMQRELDQLNRLFADLAQHREVDLADVSTHLDELAVIVKGHCEHEERDAEPLLQKYLRPSDLGEFHKFTRSGPDSMLVFGWVCDGAAPEDQQAVWSLLPAPVRLFLKPIMNRKYGAFKRNELQVS